MLLRGARVPVGVVGQLLLLARWRPVIEAESRWLVRPPRGIRRAEHVGRDLLVDRWEVRRRHWGGCRACLLYTSDAADDM
eukprot:7571169-Alexandrium_andersonii.AAC.1